MTGRLTGRLTNFFWKIQVLRTPRYFWRFWRWTHSWNSRTFDFTKTQRFVSANIIDGRKYVKLTTRVKLTRCIKKLVIIC